VLVGSAADTGLISSRKPLRVGLERI